MERSSESDATPERDADGIHLSEKRMHEIQDVVEAYETQLETEEEIAEDDDEAAVSAEEARRDAIGHAIDDADADASHSVDAGELGRAVDDHREGVDAARRDAIGEALDHDEHRRALHEVPPTT